MEPMEMLSPYFMNKRVDAMNATTIDIPYEPMQNYINEKRKQGIDMSHMALIISAYVRTLAEFPYLNRFVVNSKVYKRNEICVAMVVLNGEGSTMSKMYFEKTDTINEVNEKINKYVTDNRETPEKNGLESVMKAIIRIPGLVKFIIGLLKFMDNHGILPKSLINVSPFHSSLLISNLISIRTNHIYHHVYEFGTTSIGITMGNLREVPKRKGDEIVFERCMPLGVVMDERICDGYYFSKVFRKMKKYLKNPELLELPPEVINEDE
jgi:chloramphenicol O-acetyltransferase